MPPPSVCVRPSLLAFPPVVPALMPTPHPSFPFSGTTSSNTVVVFFRDRFCAPCIESSLRNVNHECPTCRSHITSKRSLRYDESFDELIRAVFGDIELFEKRVRHALHSLHYIILVSLGTMSSPQRPPAPAPLITSLDDESVSLSLGRRKAEDIELAAGGRSLADISIGACVVVGELELGGGIERMMIAYICLVNWFPFSYRIVFTVSAVV